MIKGIIFDLDGVLIHTDEYHYQAWKKIADSIGAKFDREVNNCLRGVSRTESLEIILKHSGMTLSDENKIKVVTDKNEIYVALLDSLSEKDVDPLVVSTLETLKNRGMKLAIGSSSQNARLILEKTRLLSFFDGISDGNNIINSKPDPEVFLKAADYISLSADVCAVVEDAVAGVEASIAGGFYTVGIGDAVKSETVDMKIQSFDELLRLVNISWGMN